MIFNREIAERYRKHAAYRAYLVTPTDPIWAHWAFVLAQHALMGRAQENRRANTITLTFSPYAITGASYGSDK